MYNIPEWKEGEGFVLSDGTIRYYGRRKKQGNWLLPISKRYDNSILIDKNSLYVSTIKTQPPKLKIKNKWRHLTPKEVLRLMGWDDKQINKINHLKKEHLYFVAGNSMVIPVMEYILEKLIIDKGEKMLKVLELFGGIQATSKALENLKIDFVSTYIDNDPKVVNVKNVLWETNDTPKDIKEFKGKKGSYDLVVAGFPCQPFSQAGKRLGFEDERGKLYKEALRIIKETNPTYVILENVKGIVSKKHFWIIEEIEKELKELGYNINREIINALNFLPQNRERVFILGTKKDFKEVKIEKSKKVLKDYLEKDVTKQYYIQETPTKIKHYTNFIVFPRSLDNKLINGSYNRAWKIDKHTGSIASSNTPKIWERNGNIRFLTEKETMRLMGWDDGSIDKIEHLPRSSLTFTIGNSMVIPVMEYILKKLNLKKGE